ncbi:MAG: DegV family protein [Lachnospiraceae bacterium]|nr:DegV family protein [Lachnospiraceae bacterium]
MSVAIITDTNSGMTAAEAESFGIHLIPMPFLINDEDYLEGVNLTHKEFYEKLEQDAEVSTSQPTPGSIIDLWEELLKVHEQLVYIPMSSGLSKSYETAAMLAASEYEGKVFVVNNRRIEPTQFRSAIEAKQLADQGLDAGKIKEILERESLEATIYIMVDTLKYLKKGGRVTAAGAAIGTVLNLKPVLTIQGDKLDACAKARGIKNAKKVMLEHTRKDLTERFQAPLESGRMHLFAVTSYVPDDVKHAWTEEVQAAFPEIQVEERELALSVSCHIGPGALAIAACRIPEEVEVVR